MRPGSIEILVTSKWKPESCNPVQYGGLSLLRPGFEIRLEEEDEEEEKTTERTSRPGRCLYFFSVFQIQILRIYNKKVRNRDSPSSKTYPDLVGKKRRQRQNKKALGSSSCSNITTTLPQHRLTVIANTNRLLLQALKRLILFPYFVVGEEGQTLTR